ncbi:hypothetical protein [Staphylococcus gallinarum]|uniref:hypothetical protein n=1 Tax=Staphylococcus gallinarum TaxID=1293 RepID=UPI001E5425A7|nr:hypothetical protein [Staphylococcus gallinarum]MCD8844304.1 hypothetical protein [Staphylococcus gallinarum]
MEFIQQNWVALVSIIVSLISAVFTAITFIRLFKLEKQNLEIEIINIFFFKVGNKLDCYISFNNLSKLPIAITNINISHKGKKILTDIGVTEILYSNEIKKQILFSTKRNSKKDTNSKLISTLYSNSLPINLKPYSSEKDIIRFNLTNDSEKDELENILSSNSENIEIEIKTTRNPVNKSFPINEIKRFENVQEFYKKFEHHKKTSNQNLT